MKSIKYFGLLLILPLITMALTTNYIIEADAEKGQGVPSSSYGSKNKGIVCGDRLCSEIPGGKDGRQIHDIHARQFRSRLCSKTISRKCSGNYPTTSGILQWW